MMREEVIGDCRLILGDCRDFEWPADVGILGDPPYGIGHQKGDSGKKVGGARLPPRRNTQSVYGDDQPFDPARWVAFDEVMLFGANNFAAWLPEGTWHAWDKLDGWTSSDSFSDVEFIWQKGPRKASRIYRHLWKGVRQASEKDAPRYHPTQKPIALMEWCIGFMKARIIADPYMGSGTCGVACIKHGRPFIGCEIDPAHYETALRRIESAYRQPRLFAEPAVTAVQEGLL